jgi:hypothetical protein
MKETTSFVCLKHPALLFIIALAIFSLSTAPPAEAVTVDSDETAVTARFQVGETVDLMVKAEPGQKIWVFLEFPDCFPGLEFARPDHSVIQEVNGSYAVLYSAHGRLSAEAEDLFYSESFQERKINFGEQDFNDKGDTIVITSKRGNSPEETEIIQQITLTRTGAAGPNFCGEYVSANYHIDPTTGDSGIALITHSFNGEGNGTGFYDGSDRDPFEFTIDYSVDDDGTYELSTILASGAIDGEGGVSSQSSVANYVDIEPDDDGVAMAAGIRKSTGMSEEDLEGEYVGVGFRSNPEGQNPETALVSYTFYGDGEGVLSGKGTPLPDFVEFPLEYSVNEDGTFSMSIPSADGSPLESRGIVREDGSVATFITDQSVADEIIGMGAFIKKSSGMSKESLDGEYVGTSYAADPDGNEVRTAHLVRSFDGDGAGVLTYRDSISGETTERSFVYIVRDDGTFEMNGRFPTGDAYVDEGIISADGSVLAAADLSAVNDVVELSIYIKKTQ